MAVEKKELFEVPETESTFGRIGALFRVYRALGVNFRMYAIAILLSVVSVIFKFLGFKLLIPLIQAIIEGDSTFARRSFGFSSFVNRFPELFDTHVSTLVLLMAAIIFVGITKNIFDYFSDIFSFKQSMIVETALKSLLFERFLSFGKIFYDKRDLGQLSNILMYYSTGVSGQLNNFKKAFTQSLTSIAYLLIMVFISWKLTILVIVLFPFSEIITSLFIKKVEQRSEATAEKQATVSRRIFNSLLCIPLIQSCCKIQAEKARFDHASREYSESEFIGKKNRAAIQPFQDMSTIVLLLIVAFCLVLLEPGRTSPKDVSSFVVFFILLRMAAPGFFAINELRISLAEAFGPISRVFRILKGNKAWDIEQGEEEFPGLQEKIEFDQLYFSYGKRPVLRNVTFSIEKGETIAIVGATGSGKTTIFNTLLRYYNVDSNRIRIDGRDIRDYTATSLRRHIALVSQQSYFFEGTLKENILYGARDPDSVSDDEFSNILETAGLSELIERLPDGVDSQVGALATLFSGGEKQLISAARALLSDAQIILFDEATSALDAVTEERVRNVINEVSKTRTAILISHDLSSISHADKIVILTDGKTTEKGSTQELLKIDGTFLNYWNAQERGCYLCKFPKSQ